MGGTTPHLYSVCIECLVASDVDLLVVEFSLGPFDRGEAHACVAPGMAG